MPAHVRNTGLVLVPLQDTYVAVVMHEAESESSSAGVRASSAALGRAALAVAGLAAFLVTARLRRSWLDTPGR